MSTNNEWKILEKIHEILREEGANDVPNEEPVIRFHHPEDLKVNHCEEWLRDTCNNNKIRRLATTGLVHRHNTVPSDTTFYTGATTAVPRSNLGQCSRAPVSQRGPSVREDWPPLLLQSIVWWRGPDRTSRQLAD